MMRHDVDRAPPNEILSALHRGTGSPMSTIRRTTFHAWEGVLLGEISEKMEIRWLIRLGANGNARLYHGLQFCPLCLSEQIPYMRKRWRLSPIVACTVHKIKLHDCCHQCGAPVTIHRYDLHNDRHIEHVGNPLTHCSDCLADRRAAPQVAADASILQIQEQIEQAIESGWANLSARTVHSIPFFDGLYILVGCILNRRHSDRLLRVLAERLEMDVELFKNTELRFEFCRHEKRYGLMRLLANLLSDWPETFITSCAEASVSSSYIFDHGLTRFGQIPFWLWEPVSRNLNRLYYAPTDGEIDEAMRYLKRHKKRARRIDLVRLIGVASLNKRTLARLAGEFDQV
jgi:hypothetical protein